MPAVYIRHMMREFPDPATILHGSDLHPRDLAHPDRFITVEQNLRCLTNAMRAAHSPDWYLPWGLRIGGYIHGPLTPAMLTAPTLGDGLNVFLEYFGTRIPYMAIRAHRRFGWFEIELSPLLEVDALLRPLIEIPFLILQQYIDAVRAASFAGAVIELGYGAPEFATQYQTCFECDVRFHARRHCLAIPESWRHTPNLGYDDVLWQAALQECAKLARRPIPRSPGMQVRSQLLRHFGDTQATVDIPTLVEIAHRLNLSPRTLIRRLREDGTTYQDEIDRIRRQRSEELLRASERSIGEIADLLGFADAAGFSKAFRRWFRTSPGTYRKRLADPGYRDSD